MLHEIVNVSESYLRDKSKVKSEIITKLLEVEYLRCATGHVPKNASSFALQIVFEVNISLIITNYFKCMNLLVH